MRCFARVLTASSCLFIASLLGAPTANAADGARDASSARVSSGHVTAAQPNRLSAPDTAAQRFGDLPLSFEANQGQTDSHVRFLSRGSGYSFFLTQTGAVLSFSPDAHSATVLQMQLTGSSPNARLQGLDELPGKSNYFFGSDSSRWRTGVPTFAKVAYENIYPGISLVYYGNQQQLEYDFVVAPGADPRQIRLTVSGAQKLTVDAQGNLVLRSPAGDVQLLAPKVYQQIGGQKQAVTGQWQLEASNSAGFRLGSYDRTQALVIDPVLMYSSFLGGSQKNSLSRIAIDAAGNAYVAGYTTSGDFPAAPTPQSMTFGSGAQSRGAFVAKIDPTGANLLYSTYLSGSADEEATGLAVDTLGNVYLAGNTHSTDFPTRDAFQSTCNTHTTAGTCSSAFLTKISPSGDSLLFSTYLGGSGGESARSLVVDSKGSAYVAGITSSSDFPVTAGTAQAKCAGACQQSAFVAKFTATGESLTYATYLGGSGIDDAADLAVDASGNIYIAGHTTSPDFPLATPFQKSCTPDAASSSKACVATAFVTKLKADGSAFTYSTYLGGTLGSQASAIAVDSVGSAYVTGNTQSADFPIQKAFQKSCGIDPASHQCSIDAFVTKLDPSGKTLIYSTYLGGSGNDTASGIIVDRAGNAHIVGTTASADFPTAASLQSKLKGASDAFIARFNPSGSALAFSTYHGGSATESGNGIALDPKGNIYLTGETSSPDFPTRHPFQSSCAGACANAFVTKMSAPPPTGATVSTTTLTPVPTPNPSTYGQTVTLSANVTGSSGTPTGTVDFMNGAILIGTGTLDGTGNTSIMSGTLVVGADSVTGVYSGDATYATSTSAPVTQNVTAATTTTAIAAAPASPSVFGQSVTFTATVSVTPPGVGPAVGSVDFTQDGAAITGCTGQPVNGLGKAVCTTAAIAVGGPYTIKAAYNPTGGNFLTSSTTTSYTVNAASTTTTVAAAPTGSSPLGQSVTFTASVAVNAPGFGTPVGTVGFTASGTPIAGCATVAVNVSGSAACATSALAAGSYTIKATYTPSGGNFTGSNGTLSAAYAVVAPPALAKTFVTNPIKVNGTTFLNFTLTNPTANTVAENGVAFTDALPSGLTATGSGAVCGGTLSTATSAGISTITFTGGTIPVGAPGTCALTSLVTVTAVTAGDYTNQTGTISSANGGTGNLATAPLSVVGPPTIAKTFSNNVLLNVPTSTATLTLKLGNPASSVTLAGVAVSDTLPSGMSFAPAAVAATTCAGGTANAAAGVLSLTGATIAATTNCTVTVNVVGTAAGSILNTTGNVTSTNGGTGAKGTANLIVVAPPVLAEAFNVPSIALGSSTTLNFTISNPAANTVAEAGVAFSDTLQTGLTATAVASNTCGGTAAASGSAISLSGATVPVGAGGNPGSCLLSVTVTGAAAGSYTNLVDGNNGTVLISSTNGGTGVAPLQPATLSVVAPPTVTKAFSANAITLGASTTLTFSLASPAVNTVPVTGVAFSDPLQGGLTETAVVSNTCGGTASTSGTTITLSGATVPVGTGGNPGKCALAVTVQGTAGGLNIPNTTGAITSTNGGPGTISNTVNLTVQDYQIAAVDNTAVFIQGSTVPAAATATVTPLYGYTNTVSPSSPDCTPSGLFTCTFAGTQTGNVPVTITAGASTPVGAYPAITLGATDNSVPAISHSAAPLTLFVECSYSLGNASLPNTVPTYGPNAVTPGASPVAEPYSLFVTETAGGTNCPWTGATSSSGVTLVTGASGGQVSAPGTGSPVTFSVTSIANSAPPQEDTITVNYFQVGPSDPGNVGSSTLNVVQETPVPATSNAGVSSSTLTVSANPNNQSGFTLTFPTVTGLAAPTVCNAVSVAADGTVTTDPVNNFGFTCAVNATPPPSGTFATVPLAGTATTFTLQVSVPSSAQAALHHRQEPGKPVLFYAFLLGLPAIVFVGTGTLAFGSQRQRLAVRRLTSRLGILLVLALLVLLPACSSGGFLANFGGNQTAFYSLTVMGYVTDSTNTVQGVEIFTVPFTILK